MLFVCGGELAARGGHLEKKNRFKPVSENLAIGFSKKQMRTRFFLPF